MAWIEVHQSLLTHRKTLALADALDIPPVYVLGHVVSLWLWSLDNAPDGDLSGLSPRILALAAQWPGDPKLFRQAMVTVGFIDDSDERSDLHDWLDYAGRLAERREKERERSRDRRLAIKSLKGVNERPVDLPTTEGRPMVDLPTTAGTGPNRTGPTEITAVISAVSNDTALASNCDHLLADAPNGGTKTTTAASEKSEDRQIWTEFVAAGLPEPMTRSERGKWNRAIFDLREAGVQSKHIRWLVKRYRERFPSVECTPTAIAANLGLLRSTPPNGHARDRPPLHNDGPHYLSDEEARKKQEDEEECLKQYYPSN